MSSAAGAGAGAGATPPGSTRLYTRRRAGAASAAAAAAGPPADQFALVEKLMQTFYLVRQHVSHREIQEYIAMAYSDRILKNPITYTNSADINDLNADILAERDTHSGFHFHQLYNYFTPPILLEEPRRYENITSSLIPLITMANDAKIDVNLVYNILRDIWGETTIGADDGLGGFGGSSAGGMSPLFGRGGSSSSSSSAGGGAGGSSSSSSSSSSSGAGGGAGAFRPGRARTEVVLPPITSEEEHIRSLTAMARQAAGAAAHGGSDRKEEEEDAMAAAVRKVDAAVKNAARVNAAISGIGSRSPEDDPALLAELETLEGGATAVAGGAGRGSSNLSSIPLEIDAKKDQIRSKLTNPGSMDFSIDTYVKNRNVASDFLFEPSDRNRLMGVLDKVIYGIITDKETRSRAARALLDTLRSIELPKILGLRNVTEDIRSRLNLFTKAAIVLLMDISSQKGGARRTRRRARKGRRSTKTQHLH